jgi:hypothetical protein
MELQKAASADEDSYAGSLKKEKAKQEAQNKKSKADRRKDLCETLGRGC